MAGYFKNWKLCDAIDIHVLLEDSGSQSPFKFVKTSKAGIATLANRRIKRGELVYEERPLINYVINSKESEDKYLKDLSSLEKELFFSCHDSAVERPGQLKSFSGILNTNLFQTGVNSGFFLKLTRINHACRPNAHYSWDSARHIMRLYAQDDIEEDQEIFISYTFFGTDTETRKKSLRDSFKFTCSCQLCSRTNKTEVELSDQRRSRIEELKRESQELETVDPKLALQKLEELLEIYNQEDLMYYGSYAGSASELYLKILIGLPVHERNIKLLSEYAKYTLGNYTIAFGREYVDREYHWVKTFL